jgi:hypothetical protein
VQGEKSREKYRKKYNKMNSEYKKYVKSVDKRGIIDTIIVG